MQCIGLMDCNNFFVSCERLFRPDLWKKPVAVLSSNDGCIVARSQEVKDLGIPMGIPYFQVRDICKKEHITLFSSNFKLYRDISKRVMRVLTEEFDTYEIYSVDEAFFVVPTDVGESALRGVRERILRETGMPVSIGVGATKTIAKCAADFAKKGSGVFLMNEATWEQERAHISCGSVWGIGRQTTAKLTKDGVRTVKEFLALDPAYVQKQFGVGGMRKRMELSGTPAYAVGEAHEVEHQSIMSTRSFARTTSSLSELQSAVGFHVTELAAKLRKRELVAGHIYVMARPSRHSDFAYRNYGADSPLLHPTDSTSELLKKALELLEILYDEEVPYKKAGVTLGGLLPKAYASGELFADPQEIPSDALLSTIDHLNQKYGKGMVRPGVVTSTSGLPSSAQRRSQEYTTDWRDIQKVKAI